jgi:DNA-binding CsgD family transcriptional regulator
MPEMSLVGREAALVQVAALRTSAGDGSFAALVIEGEAGIGKTALAEAAARAAVGDGWTSVWVQGVESDALLAHGGLLSLVAPLRRHLALLPETLRTAISAALGWTDADVRGERFLVDAATMSLLAVAAEEQPLLVVVDDLQWLDRESADAILFAARRLRHDRVCFLLTAREGSTPPVAIDDCNAFRLTGLSMQEATRLLGPGYTPAVVGRLTRATAGNPLALVECGRVLSSVQRAGAAELPDSLPVPDRLRRLYSDELTRLTPEGWFAVRLAAASHDQAAGPIVAAMTHAGLEPGSCLEQAADVVRSVEGEVVFRHPLLRSAAWQLASAAERREAHAALAAVLPAGQARTWHRVEMAVGFDRELAGELAAMADMDRSRRGYGAASAASERAARLQPDASAAVALLASATEDAYVAGDAERTRRLAGEVLDRTLDDAPRATVLLALGMLELNTGTFARARDLFTEAVGIASGRLLIRILAELASICYIFDDSAGMTAVAERASLAADPTDPEQAMLAAYLTGAADVFAGRGDRGRPLVRHARDLLETEPSLRDDPRYLVVALLTVRWLMDPGEGVALASRRIAAARERGALGALAFGLSLAAGGLSWMGRHVEAYATAGEAVDLLEALGYQSDPGVAYETLAVECAARGLHSETAELLRRAEEVLRRTGFTTMQPHLAHTVISCALSRGDLGQVVTVAEEQLRLNGGSGLLLEPLGVAPWLVEAYAGLGRDDDARVLAQRYAKQHADPYHPYIAAMVARCQALVANDLDIAVAAFDRAIGIQLELADRSETGRTRLMYGMRLRRSGQRVAARTQLRDAAQDFAAIDHTAWTERVTAELAATGERARSRTAAADTALTSQETRVALLVAQGMTNREVAKSLFLSPKTVEHHLGSVLRKRGLRSRTELARDLARGSGPEPA